MGICATIIKPVGNFNAGVVNSQRSSSYKLLSTVIVVQLQRYSASAHTIAKNIYVKRQHWQVLKPDTLVIDTVNSQ